MNYTGVRSRSLVSNVVCEISGPRVISECGQLLTVLPDQHHARDIRYQAPPLFSHALKRSGSLGTTILYVPKIHLLALIS